MLQMIYLVPVEIPAKPLDRDTSPTVGKLLPRSYKTGLPKDLVLYSGRHNYGTHVLRETGNLAALMKTMGTRCKDNAVSHPEVEIVRESLNTLRTMMVQ